MDKFRARILPVLMPYALGEASSPERKNQRRITATELVGFQKSLPYVPSS
jgi:hypothetical protein